jgi:hypothetical protein
MGIFTGYDTDKAGHHTYEPFYERELGARKDEIRGVLELGIYHGGSLRAFRDYCPNAVVVGMDVDSGTLFESERIFTFQGDVRNAHDLHLVGTYAKPYDVIIDDASHRPIDQFHALKNLWRYLAPGGLYIIEDLDLNWDGGLMTTMHMIVRGETADIRIHLGDPINVRNDDILLLEKR